ncbi:MULTISPECIES: hypothetical protein [unclassified Aureispira]|uniref:hypothetical protein n=1 Tax=unclassified Aureispira TaxID=2649989 RepID=UPI000695DE18|nr:MULTISPECIES: hypothetical protein [unclassified Aureispira]WMX16639.1 hypothetical protein QP953_09695 [Aureispira sp. CCB-E]
MFQYFKFLFIFCFFISSCASEVVKKEFKSANGFYSLEYPETLQQTYEKNILNINPGDNSSAMTVASYYFAQGVTDEIMVSTLNMFTERYEPTSEPVKIRENVWKQTCKETSKEGEFLWEFWLNRKKNVLVLISITYKEAETSPEMLHQYHDIISSIKNSGQLKK